MATYLKHRGVSVSTVVLVLVVIAILQGGVSYSTTFGSLGALDRASGDDLARVGWLGLRGLAIVVTFALWVLDRRHALSRAIVLTNGLLTMGLVANLVALLGVLSGSSSQDISTLLTDVVLMAITNILVFSIWYWLLDPPGISDGPHEDRPWDFLFPQRAAVIPHYETWLPRYTDYLYVAFTASFSFSPTDAMPLTRRAKLLMLLQAAISIVTLTGIASSAINILAGASGS